MNIEKYIGIPFVHHGESLKGADCWGLVKLILSKELHILHPYVGDYGDDKDSLTIEKLFYVNMHRYWEKVTQPKLGDCIVFQVRNMAAHVGLIIDSEFMIHTVKGKDSCLERYKSIKWNKRTEGFYRYVG